MFRVIPGHKTAEQLLLWGFGVGWEHGQKEVFDVELFNSLASMYCSTFLPQCYRLEKKGMYEERVWDVELETYTALVHLCTIQKEWVQSLWYFSSTLLFLLYRNSGQSYGRTIHWLRCKLTFSTQH